VYKDWSSQWGHWFKVNIQDLSFIVLFILSINFSSHYLFVFDNDRVTCYTGAYGVASEDVDD